MPNSHQEILNCKLSKGDIKHAVNCKVHITGEHNPSKDTKEVKSKNYILFSAIDKEAIDSKTGKTIAVPAKRPRGRPPRDGVMAAMQMKQFQSSFEEYIKPKLQEKLDEKKTETNNSTHKNLKPLTPRTYGRKSTTPKVNNVGKKVKYIEEEIETYHWLDFTQKRLPQIRSLGYDFETLVNEVKHMKLPSSEWKIKIMVHKKEMVSISFTNKQEPERCVSINAKTRLYEIMIDGKKAVLVGAPLTLTCIKDLEILLDIINSISADNSCIEYI